MFKPTLLGTVCGFSRHFYENHRVAIRLHDAETFEPFASMTINIPDQTLGEREIILNRDTARSIDALVDAQMIEPPHREVASGMAMYPVARLTQAFDAHLKDMF